MLARFFSNKLLFILLATALLVAAYAAFAGGTPEPGSSDDPIVTKSYVTEYVAGQLSQVLQQQSFQWKVLTLEQGQVFKGSAGVELILRTGKAIVVDPTPNGIPDVTSGTNLARGMSVPLNHLFLIPRSDGRGIKAVNQVIFMYRGEGKIE